MCAYLPGCGSCRTRCSPWALAAHMVRCCTAYLQCILGPCNTAVWVPGAHSCSTNHNETLRSNLPLLIVSQLEGRENI